MILSWWIIWINCFSILPPLLLPLGWSNVWFLFKWVPRLSYPKYLNLKFTSSNSWSQCCSHTKKYHWVMGNTWLCTYLRFLASDFGSEPSTWSNLPLLTMWEKSFSFSKDSILAGLYGWAHTLYPSDLFEFIEIFW